METVTAKHRELTGRKPRSDFIDGLCYSQCRAIRVIDRLVNVSSRGSQQV